MELKSCHYKLKSHPEKFLKDHLCNVAETCKKLTSSKNLNFPMEISNVLSEVAYIIGGTHDFGKATKFFQEYINERDEKRKKNLKNSPETKHGLLSAIFTYHVVKNFILKQGLSDDHYYSFLPIIAFMIVKRHHGDLENGIDEIKKFHDDLFLNKGMKILKEQLNSIEESEIEEILSVVLKNMVTFSDFKSEFDKIIRDIDKEYNNLLNLKNNNLQIDKLYLYFITLFLYSILLESDKSDAMDTPIIEREKLQTALVDNYKKNKFDDTYTKINEMRKKIYQEVINQVEELSLEDKIYSLNVPTGTGKTLTAFSFALKLRERIEKEKGFLPRIIYALPFLSIIDQNYSVFEDVFSIQYKEKIPSNILLKHHHLSDVFYKTEEDEFNGIDIEKAKFLIEGWNSEIVVTTFIQFFHSIITNKNSAVRKFHNIVNSIVLLDEIQTIPHKYWCLLNNVLSFLSKYFNIYFVLITATQPLIFDENKGEIKALIKNKQDYFENLNRVSLNILIDKEIPIDKFKEILLNDIIQRKDKNFLIILNTIGSSKNVYEFIRDKLKDENTELYYLSTNIVPIERMKRINMIKMNGRKRKIIVSTQLIEAGIDIDVDIVYRDFAPLDSINQISGRCNRNYRENYLGEINVYAIKDSEKDRFFYSYIYDGFLTSKTKETLYGKNKIQENEFIRLNDKYFEKVKNASSTDDSKNILNHIFLLEYKETGNFKLIEEDYEKADIFVEIDDNAKEIWNKFDKIMNEKNIKKRWENLLEIKN
ncbi:MAG: CRISPR-associated helicase Cas3' [Thermoplasmata archaeon]